MKTRSRLPRLTGWVGRCTAAFLALAFCASASAADPSKNVVGTRKSQTTQPQVAQRSTAKKKEIYILISGSAIPQPIDRVAGPIATTAIPMYVIGNPTD